MLLDTQSALTSLHLTVRKVTQLTPRIRAFELRAVDGGELPIARPGAHLAIPIRWPDGHTDVRHYSLCQSPLARDHYRIAVLQEPEGHGGSVLLHEQFVEGYQLECPPPISHFQLHADSSPALLIAGGIGITPIMSLAYTLAMRGRRFQLHYAGRRLQDMAFVDELQRELPRQLHLYPGDQDQRMDVMQLLADITPNTYVYACGPQRLLADVETSARLLGIHNDHLQSERFAPDKFASDKPVTLELMRSQQEISVAADQPLLAALRDAGIPMNFDCCVGDCGTCAVTLLAGEPDHRDHVLNDAERANGRFCPCVSRALSDRLVLDL